MYTSDSMPDIVNNQGSYTEVCVKFKDFSRTSQDYLQFLRTKSLGKILIEVLKLFFKNARLR